MGLPLCLILWFTKLDSTQSYYHYLNTFYLINFPDRASKIKHTPRASTRSFAWYFLSPCVLTSLKWTSLQPNETHKKVTIYLLVSSLSILAWYRENGDGMGALQMYAAKIKILTSWRWGTSSTSGNIWSPHLSCKRDQIKNMRDYMDRPVPPPKQVNSLTWSPPPTCK